MDGGSLTPGPIAAGRGGRRPTWKLRDDIAPKVQGIAVTGFGELPEGRALFLELPEPCSGAWIAAVEAIVPVTSAVPQVVDAACAIALSASALRKMRFDAATLATFSRPFREGMFQVDRLRRLGDRRGDAWQDTVADGGPRWSANAPPMRVPYAARAFDVAAPDEDSTILTGETVDVLVLLYARTDAGAAALADAVTASLGPLGVKLGHALDLKLDVEGEGDISREHFGFADGLSQPEPYDEAGAVLLEGGPLTSAEENPVQRVPLGEFLLGHVNGHHEIAPGPAIAGDAPRGPDPKACGLDPHPEALGFFDFGLNGSYLVVRELRQDVAAFWRSMQENAERIRAADSAGSAHVTADWLAERVIGRDRDGHLLCPGNARRPPRDGRPDNDYLFLADDPRGAGCPPGSHVRRAYPRDALAPRPSEGPTLLAAANNHRILRRGRKFGPKLADRVREDGAYRGLLFLCLNTDIARQFEFIQQTWLLNRDFATLGGEVDPLVGPEGAMTLRDEPLRRRIRVETYVQMTGGDYFFLPSLPALRYLERLR